jgi:hypothetical protein
MKNENLSDSVRLARVREHLELCAVELPYISRYKDTTIAALGALVILHAVIGDLELMAGVEEIINN